MSEVLAVVEPGNPPRLRVKCVCGRVYVTRQWRSTINNRRTCMGCRRVPITLAALRDEKARLRAALRAALGMLTDVHKLAFVAAGARNVIDEALGSIDAGRAQAVAGVPSPDAVARHEEDPAAHAQTYTHSRKGSQGQGDRG